VTIFDKEFTQEEITARINASEWAYMPVKNVQVRFGDNGQIEASGNLNTNNLANFVNFIGGVGYSQEDVQTGLDWIDRFTSDPAVYINASASVENNLLILDISEVKIGRWSPDLEDAADVLNTATRNSLKGVAGLYIDSALFSDGILDFKGVAPTTIYVKH